MPLVAYASGDAMMPAAINDTTILLIFITTLLLNYNKTTPVTALQLNKQTDIRISSEPQERRGTAIFDIIDEFALVEFEQIDRHLAGNEFHLCLEAQVAQFLQRCNAMLLELCLLY